MKRHFLILAAVLSLMSLPALGQSYQQRPSEEPRAIIRPYHKLLNARQDNGESLYMAPIYNRVDSQEQTSFSFAKPFQWMTRQVLLRVESAPSAYEIFVNGKKIDTTGTAGICTEYNITKLTADGKNDIRLVPVLHFANRLCETSKGFGKIEIISQPTIRVRDIALKTYLNEQGDGVAEFGIAIKCDALNRKMAELDVTIRTDSAKVLTHIIRPITLEMRGEDTVRFSCIVPKESLWSPEVPHISTIEITNLIDNRPVEYICHKAGFRELRYDEDGNPVINGKSIRLRCEEYSPASGLDSHSKGYCNALIINRECGCDSVMTECDRRGILVLSRSAIRTKKLGDHIRRGGNPSNNPQYLDQYIIRNRENYYCSKTHPSLIGVMIADGKTNGYCIYETYLQMKRQIHDIPVIYQGAGKEWCTDRVKF